MSVARRVAPAINETVVPVLGDGVFPVRRIYCVGRNYLEHIREMKEADERDPPFFFQKPRDSIVQHDAVVPYPPLTSDFQFEGELVLAIGRPGRNIGLDAALDHVFGYAAGIDLTRRDRQRDARDMRLPWEIGKSFDASAPCGTITSVSDGGHRLRGNITLSVNGQERQRGDLEQMIWNVPEIVMQLSRQVTLATGDLIFTGTPAGVGAVVPGDDIEVAIDGLTPLRISIAPPEE
jgi:fumarylpyruvate hydrolase